MRLNAALRAEGETYSQFVHTMKEKKVELDRKVLAQIASEHPEVFKGIVAQIKK